MKKSFWLTLVLLSLSVIIVACGSDGTSSEPEEEGTEQTENASDATNEGEVVELVVHAENYAFDQAEYEVPLGATVEVTFENMEGYHEALIEGYDVTLTEDETVAFVADEAGEFELLCSVVCGPIDDHENMKSTLVVTE
ncbi:hypothetical protein [Shouchella shacheensis]|uniref:hypothetical protein n=1 Tax=Shouchella shacheensis TaxID=1649580 RepID=UPI00073FA93F|nr:hypothetical protein [Shouchella shacheensis]